MATDNKAVTTYLPRQVEESLAEYCKSNGLIRKDKHGTDRPALGTAIIAVLKDYFKISSESSTQSNLVQSLEENVVSRVKDSVIKEVIDLVEERFETKAVVDSIYQKLLLEIQNLTKVNDSVGDSTPISTDNVISTQGEPLVLVTPSSDEIKYLGTELAKRFNLKSPKFSDHIKKGIKHFEEWSKDKDPDGITWGFKSKDVGKGYFYFPSSNTDSTLLNKLRSTLSK